MIVIVRRCRVRRNEISGRLVDDRREKDVLNLASFRCVQFKMVVKFVDGFDRFQNEIDLIVLEEEMCRCNRT